VAKVAKLNLLQYHVELVDAAVSKKQRRTNLLIVAASRDTNNFCRRHRATPLV
ncbi:MAG: hypothetical protein RL482_1031, partial [Actinomycetota bacterium]